MIVAEALKSNSSLTVLAMNYLNEVVGIAIADALESNCSLATLKLASNDLNGRGGIALASP